MPTWRPPWFHRWLVVKNLLVSAGDARDEGSIPGSGKSLAGGNSYSLQYSCLENSIIRGGWQVTVHGVAKSQTWLNVHPCTQLGKAYLNRSRSIRVGNCSSSKNYYSKQPYQQILSLSVQFQEPIDGSTVFIYYH